MKAKVKETGEEEGEIIYINVTAPEHSLELYIYLTGVADPVESR